jgi:endo-1,4-beta-xylanase
MNLITASLFVNILLFVISPTQLFANNNSLLQHANNLNIQLGTTASAGNATYIPEYNQFVKDHFNLYVSDWEAHWAIDKSKPLRPTIATYDWEWLDQAVAISQDNNQPFRGHHLVWGNPETLPSWLLSGTFTQEELQNILEEHITTVVTRYKGRVDTWSVINELYGVPWDESSGFWDKNLDNQLAWVYSTFRWANAADPDAKLILNDAGVEFPNDPYYGADRYNQIYALVEELVGYDTPIHGVGFQMHLQAKDFLGDKLTTKMQELAININRYQALGLEVIITELDVRLDGLEGTQEDKYDLQADIYEAVFQTALDSGVTNITLFGLTDEYSWYKDVYPGADATIFTDFTSPKPAHTALYNLLSDRQAPSSPVCKSDINSDNIVDITDYSVLVSNFLSTSPTNPKADINQDNIVDITDYSLLASSFLQTCQ